MHTGYNAWAAGSIKGLAPEEWKHSNHPYDSKSGPCTHKENLQMLKNKLQFAAATSGDASHQDDIAILNLQNRFWAFGAFLSEGGGALLQL